MARPRARRGRTHGTVTLTGLVTIVIATALPPAAPSEGSIRTFLPEVPVRAQCVGREVLRPSAGECVAYDDASPFLDPKDGLYDAGRDRGNWVTPGDDTLELLAIEVIDNGEGSGWPHGPQGNLFFDFFRPDEPTDVSRDGAHRRRIAEPRVLRGPHRTHGITDEWLDDELVAFRDAGLFRWGSAPGTEDAVVMRIFETDSHAEDGFLGRRNDVLGMTAIDRAATTRPEGVWVTFHPYTNDHPRRARPEIAIRALVRTGRGAPADRHASRAEILASSCAADPNAPAAICAPFAEPLPTRPTVARTATRKPPAFPASVFRSAAALDRTFGSPGEGRSE